MSLVVSGKAKKAQKLLERIIVGNNWAKVLHQVLDLQALKALLVLDNIDVLDRKHLSVLKILHN